MFTRPACSPRHPRTLGFLLAFLLVLLSTTPINQPVGAAALYPPDFDPLYDLPLPPAWRDSADFTATSRALRDRIDQEGQARVRVELRLPAVEPDRLDESQGAQWRQDQTAAQVELLDALPDGSYQRLDEQPSLNRLVMTGTGAASGGPKASDPPIPLDGSHLSLVVGEVALEGLMASERVAEVQAIAADARIAAGGDHSLYLAPDGNLWAWGDNAYGQLGDGTITASYSPIPILTDVTAIAAGRQHTLALTSDGNLWAWGANNYGQLGDGTASTRSTPTQVLTGVISIAAGGYHSLALTTDGSLLAWGRNDYGQVGDATTTVRYTPTQVFTGVTAMAAGYFHSLALTSDGNLWAWGANSYGQLGDDTTLTRIAPTPILAGVAALAAGGYHSLALLTDDSLSAWGRNNFGQLGDGTTTDVHTPIPILTGVAAMAAGIEHSLALTTDGNLWAWGNNGAGQLGDGTTTTRTTPTQVMTDVLTLAAGYYHSLALTSDGRLWAWGANSYGQLGDGTTTSRVGPTQTIGIATDPPAAPTDLAVQAVSTSSISLAWTDGSDSELGFEVERRTDAGTWTLLATLAANATGYSDAGLSEGVSYGYRVRSYNTAGYSTYTPEVTSPLLPKAPTGLGASAVSAAQIDLAWTDNSAGETDYRVERKTGTNGTWGEIATLAANATTYADTSLAGPDTYFYRVRAANAAGYSSYSNQAFTTLTVPNAPDNLTAKVLSPSQILLLWEDGSDNETEVQIERKTGAGGTWDLIATVPANTVIHTDKVPDTNIGLYYRVRALNGVGLSGYSNEAMAIATPEWRLAAGGLHSLLIGFDGSLWAWGSNGAGQLGDGTTTTRTLPTPVLPGVTAMAAGLEHTLALTDDGSLWAWGDNLVGQLGDGTTTSRYRPTQILSGIAATAAGYEHSLALKTDGSLWAWGWNASGQIGDGTTADRHTPTQILTGIAAMAAGYQHSLALETDGSLWAWGYNPYGQVGDGTLTTRTTPTSVLDGVVSLAAGFYHTLALKADGSLWAWGRNDYGALGDGTTTNRTRPTQILTGVVAVAAGGLHSLALKRDGSLWVWGGNWNGQLGTGAAVFSATPTQVLTGVTAMAAGYYHTLALTSDGRPWAWGRNDYGQLGDGTLFPSFRPVPLMNFALDLPSAPIGLGVQAISSARVTLSWTDTSNNELSFQIERRSGGGNWAPVATLGANATGYVDTGLNAAVTYDYRVRAANTAGFSGYSNEVSATTLIRVAARAGAHGRISPAARQVASGLTTRFTVTPDPGYNAIVTGCGGSLIGKRYTTGPITAPCTVRARFVPQVTIAATDNVATEAGLTTGTFTFTRTGATTSALTASYQVTGTATAGQDYQALGASITFPAGASQVTKTLVPLQDNLVEPPETIILKLRARAAYAVGKPASARIILSSDD